MDAQGRVHGHLDPPLTTAGRIRARQIARSLKGKGITRIYSSPRKRATEMATIISKELGIPMETNDDLVPWDIGKMSGAKTSSIMPLLQFFSLRPDRQIPGGESKSSVLTRYKRFASRLKPGDAVAGHSQHSLAWDHVRNGGNASKVPMFGGKSGEIKEIAI